jgi:ankyrin repeat protein
MGKFPKLRQPSVFIAGPGDVHRLRRATIGILDDLKRRAADDHGVTIYDWTYEIGGVGFDAWQPPQSQIPLPSGPLCSAVLCIFGEKIGTPLRNMPTDHVGHHADPKPAGAYRLVPSWPETAEEAIREAESGGFPLTGTVFECLAALHANKLSGGGDATGSPPVMVVFVGSEEMVESQEPIDRAGWGDNFMLDSFGREYSSKKDYVTLGKWVENTYRPQLLQLKNFLLYLKAQNVDPVFVHDNTFEAPVRRFLRKALRLPEPSTERDPFKGLDAYDVGDRDLFYGRELERDETVYQLQELWRSAAPTFLGIVAGSGVGKSSFLRAGLVGHLCDRTRPSEHEYYGLVVTPAELLVHGSTSEVDPLLTLFHYALETLAREGLIEADRREHREADPLTVTEPPPKIGSEGLDKHLEGAVAARVEELSKLRPELRPSEIVHRLREILKSRRLIVGLDQFEEIVDQRTRPETYDRWQPLVDFMTEGARCECIGILYTLQSNRMEALENDACLNSLCVGNPFRRLSLPTSLARIIREPFRIKGVELQAPLAQELESRMKRFADGRRDESRASLMPLLSLALKRIYDHVARPALEDLADAETEPAVAAEQEAFDVPEIPDSTSEDFNKAGRSQQPQTQPRWYPSDREDMDVVLTLVGCRDYLEVESAIADLTDEAYEAARQDAGPDWTGDTLFELLDRFVRPNHDALLESRFALSPAAIPEAGAQRRLAEEMVKRRLLIPHPKRPDQLRLVHEAVLRNWQPGIDWIESRRDLLELEERIAPNAFQWHEHGRPEDRLEPHFLDDAASLLARRYEAWHKAEADSEVAWLRDYGLALLHAYPEPSRIARGTKHDTPLVHIGVMYGDAALVRRFIEHDPECLHAARSDKRTALFAAAFVGSLEVMDILLQNGADPEIEDDQNWRPVHIAASWGSVEALRLLHSRGASLWTPGGADRDTTPLHLAAMNGRLAIAEAILEEPPANLDLSNKRGWTALHFAAYYDHATVVRRLVGEGADLEARLPFGWTPLHIASNHDREDAARALVDLRADLDARLDNGWTPLHIAARDGSVKVAEVLTHSGADLDATANAWGKAFDKLGSGWTPLHIAVENDRTVVVRLLLEAGCDRDPRTPKQRTPLHVAAEHAGQETVSALLESAPDLQALVGDEKLTALHIATQAGRADNVTALLEAGADPGARDQQERTALMLAVERGKEDVVQSLALTTDLEASDKKGRRALHLALERRHFAIARVLLDAGCDIDLPYGDGRTALHEALTADDAERIRFLLDAGASPSVPGPGLATPLHTAAEADRIDWIEALIERGASPAARAADGSTPAHLAALQGHAGIVKRLLDLGADVKEPDDRGWTPLHSAAWSGASEVVKLLLGHGSDLGDPGGDEGRAPTPLQLASETGDLDTIELLLGAGAPVETARGGRPTPLEIAVESGGFEPALRLVEAGANPRSVVDDFVAQWWARERLGEPARSAELALGRAILDSGNDLPFEIPEAPSIPLKRSREPSDGSGHALLEYDWRPAPETLGPDILAGSPAMEAGLTHDSDRTRFEISELPWYDSVRILRITDPTWPIEDLALYYLVSEDGKYRLNGTSPPIHEVNARAPIQLTPDNVLDYLRFFCFFVRGEEGPFYITESLDDPVLPRAMPPAVRKVLAGTVRPALYEGLDSDGHFLCNAVVFYSNALFAADFSVYPTGMMEMLDDEPIAADLPVRINAPITWKVPLPPSDDDSGRKEGR